MSRRPHDEGERNKRRGGREGWYREPVNTKLEVWQSRHQLKTSNTQGRIAKAIIRYWLAMVPLVYRVGGGFGLPVHGAIFRVASTQLLGKNGGQKGAAEYENGRPVPPTWPHWLGQSTTQGALSDTPSL